METRWYDPDDDLLREDGPGQDSIEKQEEEEALALVQEARDLQAVGAWENGFEQAAVHEKLAEAIRKAEKRIRLHFARAREAARPHDADADKAMLRAGRLLRAAKPGLRGKEWRSWLEQEVGVDVYEARDWYNVAWPPKRRKF